MTNENLPAAANLSAKVDMFLNEKFSTDGAVEIYGVIVNRSDWQWDDNYFVGVRKFFDKDGELISPSTEIRSRMLPSNLGPGEKAIFSFQIAEEKIPPHAVSCEVDIVNEYVFWLTDIGAESNRITFHPRSRKNKKPDWLVFLYNVSKDLELPTQRKIEVILGVLHKFDFSRYDKVKSIDNLLSSYFNGLPLRIPAPNSGTVKDSCDRSDLRGNHTSLFEHFALNCGVHPRDYNDPLELVHVFNPSYSAVGL